MSIIICGCASPSFPSVIWLRAMAKRSVREGRPLAGEGGTSVTRDYVQTTLRLPRSTKRLLDYLCGALDKSQREVLAEALELYAKRRKRDVERYVEEIRAAVRGHKR